ncbi:LuxR C-terminal-related transcriptional regulator [Ktedonobacter racemifer]|uniref:ATP-dependent transcriptional regulator, MalT-like, LuxR family n=1 Tax=Ktedonobacter racemifer DSM 44963 TaxID=485913 RepID=D6TTN0_KTERA|nr:LuxR C-terminal-related transcriptional regulator [Ktedonobacter racemifer]EFH83781.1 ATP-dependent transcriptional regulator, MalT-like, LuxR family [Ktedonobacter racemifer DSM 44963]
MARTTPRVEQEVLVLPENKKTSVLVGSQQWYSWLTEEENRSFFFVNEIGSFTARKERRRRGGWYWIAYRSQGGKLAKTYIGRSEDLGLERLREVTSRLVSQRRSQHNATLLSQSQPLVATTFLPPLHADRMIERPKLLERLDQSLSVKLTLVTAPAGFGKTTLLSKWCERFRQQWGDESTIAWITLSERDNDPTRFWSMVWYALQGEQANTDFDIAASLASTPQMPLETVLATLVNTLGKRPSGVLILDGYHVITHPQIHESMNMLLAHLPASMHLLLASRSEPPLALGRARLYGELVELRASDLRVTPGEIRRFLHTCTDLKLSDEEQALLEQRLDGWIAGLHLVGLAMRGQQRPGEVLTRLSGSQRSLFDYFAEEIFAQQPETVQHFLLSTALLTELTPPLCAAMCDDERAQGSAERARRLLDMLERANLFLVPLDEGRQRYRYHTLFREFLCEKLQRSLPDLVSHLYRRATDLYEQQGMREEALEYALAAQDTERARRLLEHMGEEWLWKKGEVARLLTWIQKLPAPARERHPHLEVLYAWALLLSGQSNLEEVKTRLDTIERRNEEAAKGALRGEIMALRARLAAFRNDLPQVLAFSQQALQVLPKERALLRADIAFGLSGTSRNLDESYRMLAEAQHLSLALGSLRTAMFASRYLAATCVDQGKLTEAEAILQQALHITGDTEQQRVPVAGFIHIGLAELCYERNELAAARRHVLLGIEMGERCGEIKSLLYGYCLLALIAAAQGEIEQGWREVRQAEQIALIGNVPWLSERIAANAVHLALLQGDLGKAKWVLRKRGIDVEQGREYAPGEVWDDELLALARVWLAEEKYDAVLSLLEVVRAGAQQRKHVRNVFVAQALQASAFLGLQRRQQAVQMLNETLNLAGPEGYLRTFLDLGEPLRKLLRRLERAGSARGYAHTLLGAFDKNLDLPSRPRGLSEREYEILQLVARGMSNQDIADTLIVAVSTIKVHVRHLCQKLDVQNRIQMVARAREKGIV